MTARIRHGLLKPFEFGHPEPAMAVPYASPPPRLPLDLFGPAWARWITDAAEAAACPADYVAAPLIASASVLIGHARWAEATPGWVEPPHLWLGVVGDSGTGKSPGADCLLGEVLPRIEQCMLADYPDQLREWFTGVEIGKAEYLHWRRDVREAERQGLATPSPPPVREVSQPKAPRLRQNDITIEKVAELLATAAPKGLLIVRDELAGWIAGMNAYHGGGRQFWLEAYGGRPYRVERKSDPDPIIVPRLAAAVYGSVQPDKLVPLLRAADDGLMGRFLWAWPEPLPFRLGHCAPGVRWAIRALDRLRELALQPGNPPSPVPVPLGLEARSVLEAFGRRMQEQQFHSRGLIRSAYGKARGQALRLTLVIEMLWWCGEDGVAPPPAQMSTRAFEAASRLVGDYFMPMAERVYATAGGLRYDTATFAS